MGIYCPWDLGNGCHLLKSINDKNNLIWKCNLKRTSQLEELVKNMQAMIKNNQNKAKSMQAVLNNYKHKINRYWILVLRIRIFEVFEK